MPSSRSITERAASAADPAARLGVAVRCEGCVDGLEAFVVRAASGLRLGLDLVFERLIVAVGTLRGHAGRR